MLGGKERMIKGYFWHILLHFPRSCQIANDLKISSNERSLPPLCYVLSVSHGRSISAVGFCFFSLESMLHSSCGL